MKILNLFSGIGGNRTLWENHEITAIENNIDIAEIYKKRFPDDNIIVEDSYRFVEKFFDLYDFIWASPPCKTHSRSICWNKPKLPDFRLYSLIIFLKKFFKGFWVVENVIPHYKKLLQQNCEIFELIKPSTILNRHYFWSNFEITTIEVEKIPNFRNIRPKQLCEYLFVDYSLIKDFKPKNFSNHDGKGTILRNCVRAEIGLHVLNCVFSRTKNC